VEFEALYGRLYPALLRYVYRLTGRRDVAEDVAQEAFVRLWAHPLTDEAEAKRWLFTVALNLVRDGERRRRRQDRLRLRWAPRVDPPDEEVERGETVAHVQRALAQLAPRERAMLLMREEGFRYEEIAASVGVAPGSVGPLLARAVRRCREAYRRGVGAPPQADEDDAGRRADQAPG